MYTTIMPHLAVPNVTESPPSASSCNCQTLGHIGKASGGAIALGDRYLLALAMATRGSRFALPGSCSESRKATMALSR